MDVYYIIFITIILIIVFCALLYLFNIYIPFLGGTLDTVINGKYTNPVIIMFGRHRIAGPSSSDNTIKGGNNNILPSNQMYEQNRTYARNPICINNNPMHNTDFQHPPGNLIYNKLNEGLQIQHEYSMLPNERNIIFGD